MAMLVDENETPHVANNEFRSRLLSLRSRTRSGIIFGGQRRFLLGTSAGSTCLGVILPRTYHSLRMNLEM